MFSQKGPEKCLIIIARPDPPSPVFGANDNPLLVPPLLVLFCPSRRVKLEILIQITDQAVDTVSSGSSIIYISTYRASDGRGILFLLFFKNILKELTTKSV